MRLRQSCLISIHAPTRGATSVGVAIGGCVLGFQSTPPQRERPCVYDGRLGHIPISIHAPTKGATIKGFKEPFLIVISIHAPTKGATLVAGEMAVKCDHFNPRPHEGSDVDVPEDVRSIAISIHAPTKGATCVRTRSSIFLRISIHAPTKGATAKLRSFSSQKTQRYAVLFISLYRNLLYKHVRATYDRYDYTR